MDAFAESDPDTWRRDIDLTFGSMLNCTHSFLPGMLDRGRGRIINIGSTSGIVGDPLLAVYSAMKGAVHAFTKVLAKEVGARGGHGERGRALLDIPGWRGCNFHGQQMAS